jgi:hypothetical protein
VPAIRDGSNALTRGVSTIQLHEDLAEIFYAVHIALDMLHHKARPPTLYAFIRERKPCTVHATTSSSGKLILLGTSHGNDVDVRLKRPRSLLFGLLGVSFEGKVGVMVRRGLHEKIQNLFHGRSLTWISFPATQSNGP